MRSAARALAAAALCLARAAAQCTLPAPPADTQFAAGQGAECAEGEVMDGTDPTAVCTVQCVAGQAQGAGTYDYTCDGAALTAPAPACAPCEAGSYNVRSPPASLPAATRPLRPR